MDTMSDNEHDGEEYTKQLPKMSVKEKAKSTLRNEAKLGHKNLPSESHLIPLHDGPSNNYLDPAEPKLTQNITSAQIQLSANWQRHLIDPDHAKNVTSVHGEAKIDSSIMTRGKIPWTSESTTVISNNYLAIASDGIDERSVQCTLDSAKHKIITSKDGIKQLLFIAVN